MARRKKTGSKTEGALTAKEMGTAVERMMAAAEAHQLASVWCRNKPGAQPPNIDRFYFLVVSFELALLSVEQSLRLLLLLQHSIVRARHNPRALYSEILHQSRGKSGIGQDILNNMNVVAQANALAPFSENELQSCLRKHDSSYSSLRYFGLDQHARLTTDWEITGRDHQVFLCLALALISLNGDEMAKRGIGALGPVNPIPESAMTEELRALKERWMSH